MLSHLFWRKNVRGDPKPYANPFTTSDRLEKVFYNMTPLINSRF